MATKKFTDNPRTTDVIILEIETTDVDGCLENPYKVDSAIVYYVERDFLGTNFGSYTHRIEVEDLKTEFQAAVAAACADPSEKNLQEVQRIQKELDSTTVSSTFYYKDRKPVEIIGGIERPAWLSTDLSESQFQQAVDEDGDPIVGTFQFEWRPDGSIREGDYFLCWTWTPNIAGDSLSAHMPFSVVGDPKAVTTTPSHITAENKYQVLLERYLPEMYKEFISDGDLTPETMSNFNQAVAEGFTVLEDYANQIIDLFDANALHESLLMYLSNLFDLKLKSSDPTLWRRQIKEAIPLFKKKGTRQAVESAFVQAGMTLNGFVQYWQIASSYTWQESFRFTGDDTFLLTKNMIVMPLDGDNFSLWLRKRDEENYIPLTSDYVSFEVDPNCLGSVKMIWQGEHNISPIYLGDGDIIRVLYEFKEVPNITAQQLEDYIQALPLLDLRDEAAQEFPPKNWNVHVLEEDDPLFSVLVPMRHPFYDPVQFGMIRTEFAYSENIYNMEEYNGSTRPSFDACHIDKRFIDHCSACLGSAYSADIGVQELSNDRMLEAQDILRENMPFHAQLYSVSFSGEFNEFVQPPVESIDFLVTIDHVQTHLSGQANPFYTRTRPDGLDEAIIDREDLADKVTVLSGKLGTGSNNYVVFICPDFKLRDLGIIPNQHTLRVLSPSSNAGDYQLQSIDGHVGVVKSMVSEPLDESQFTFDLFNTTYNNPLTAITQADHFELRDDAVLFEDLGVKTEWDVDNVPDYTGGPWKVLITAYSATPYVIKDIINGALILEDDGSLPVAGASSISYVLKDGQDNTVTSSAEGEIDAERRALVNFNDPYLADIHNFVRIGDFLLYDSVEYEVLEFSGSSFYILDWTSGDLAGVSVKIHRRLLESQVGQFGYQGIHLTTAQDHEAEFEVMDGANPPSVVTDSNQFKENFMFKINNEFFRIVEWNGKEVTLSGRAQTWKTIGAGGTTVAYSIVHFPTKEVTVQYITFDHITRDGQDPVILTVEDQIGNESAMVALATPSSGSQDTMSQEEGISLRIERRNGITEEGEL
jgi:hypothetical protein